MNISGEYSMAGSGRGTGGAFRRRDFFCIQLFGVFMFALGIVGGILIGIYAYHGGDKGQQCSSNVASVADTGTSNTLPTSTPAAPMTCKRTDPIQPVEKPEEQSYAYLTQEEVDGIRSFMIAEGLITDKLGAEISLTDNYVLAMHQFVPNKEATLRYLDDGAPFPGRFARVYVVRGGRMPPDFMEYVIGPIGSSTMTAAPQFSDGELNYESRPIDAWEMNIYKSIITPAFQTLKPLTQESFDGSFFPDGGLNIFYFNGSPGDKKGMRENRLIAYFNPWAGIGDYVLFDFVPLSATIHCEGTNTSTWYVHSFYYLNQGPFSTAEELLNAYNSGSIRKFRHPAGYRDRVAERAFPTRDTSLPYRDHAQMPPPRTYEPEGPRYRVKGQRVSWMGWSFDVTTNMIRGPSIFDVRYKGERVAYEISLNDIALIYGSDSSGRSNVMYTDATYGIGLHNGIVPSVDCPRHSTLLDTSFYNAYDGNLQISKSVCVFESDAEEAEWRHKPLSYSAGLRRTILIVRIPVYVANYDYTVEYNFHLDGKLATRIKASGLIQSTFWDPNDPHRGADDSRDAFGFRLSEHTHGMVHDHMFGFKVDLDIIDSSNSFEMIHFKAGDVVDALNSQKPGNTEKPAYFQYNVTRYLEYETVQREAGYRINLDQPKFWTVVNEKHRNQWGAKRGYHISPLGTAAQTMVDSHPAMQAISFSKYHCAVTKRKDSEQWSTNVLDGFRLNDTIGDLEKKINGEEIVNEDIVTWITVGFLHIPTTEDMPMTVTVDTGFFLKPFNFFNRTDVYDMPQYMDTFGDSYTQRPPDYRPCLEEKP